MEHSLEMIEKIEVESLGTKSTINGFTWRIRKPCLMMLGKINGGLAWIMFDDV